MTIFKVQRVVQGTNGTTRDEYVTTFFFLTNFSPNEMRTNAPYSNDIKACIDAFFLGSETNGVTVNEYMSRRYQGPATYKVYQCDGIAPTGPPVATMQSAPFAPPDLPSLPEECAVCLSYNIVPPGIIPARARGRIYIGPLGVQAMDDITSNDQPVRVNPAFMEALLAAGVRLKTQMDAIGWEWCLFSRANVDAYPITKFSVDDAFDTIRNRGTAPSTRITS